MSLGRYVYISLRSLNDTTQFLQSIFLSPNKDTVSKDVLATILQRNKA